MARATLWLPTGLIATLILGFAAFSAAQDDPPATKPATDGVASTPASAEAKAVELKLTDEEVLRVEIASRRMPRFFGQIALNDEQRARVTEVQQKYLMQVELLEKQIDALKGDMLHESEGALTAVQKELLANLRKNDNDRRKPRGQ